MYLHAGRYNFIDNLSSTILVCLVQQNTWSKNAKNCNVSYNLIKNRCIFVFSLTVIIFILNIKETQERQRILNFTDKVPRDCTGLPTKHENLETTVRNSYYKFPYVHGSLQFKTCFSLFHLLISIKRQKTLFHHGIVIF